MSNRYKHGSTSNFRKNEKVTFAVANGADGPFDPPRHRTYCSGIIVKSNGSKTFGTFYTYQVKSKFGVQTIEAREIWSRWK